MTLNRFFLKKPYHAVLVLGVFFLLLSSCAHTQDNLVLESVMDAKQRGMQKTYKKYEEEKQERTLILNMQQQIAAGSDSMTEAVLLEFPKSYNALSENQIRERQLQAPDSFPPFCEKMWVHDHLTVQVMAGKVALKSEDVLAMTKQEFQDQLMKIGDLYSQYYAKEMSSQANTKVEEFGNVIRVIVTGKYLKEGDWYTDRRYFYIFRPNYRLNIFMTSKDEDYAAAKPELDAVLNLFEDRLMKIADTPIAFKEPAAENPKA